jgi:predicted O-linked N-acetylglucosamine transferase (SPINDLY family)
VVTLLGEAHVARVGASLLGAVGLGELVANSKEQFVQISVALANDRMKLRSLRRELRERMEKSPLLDAASLARALEEQYRSAWRSFCAVADARRNDP